MSKKKHPEHVNHERWLVSYADFITLLFAFFVVLFASGQSDKNKQKKVAAAINSAFENMAIFEAHSATPALGDSGSASGKPVPVEMPMDVAPAEATPQTARDITISIEGDTPATPAVIERRVKQVLEKQLAHGGLRQGDVVLRPALEGMTLSLQEGGFFDSGSAELRQQAVPTLLALAQMLPQSPVRVEGHTDNVPMHSAQYASNWELSSARASAIARFLLEHSMINPALLSAAGYAEYHPVASNATAEGRAKNRRVDIVFLSSPATTGHVAKVDVPASPATPSPHPAPSR